MASADELKQEIKGGYEALHEAIESAAGRWQQARLGVESVLRSELDYAVTVAQTMEALRLPERKQFELQSSNDALSALSEVTEVCTRVFGYVEDRDLVKTTPYMDNIGGVMQAAADQAKGSAQQIKAAS